MSVSFLILANDRVSVDLLCSILLEQGYFVQIADQENLAIKLLETDPLRYHGLFTSQSSLTSLNEIIVRFKNQHLFKGLPLLVLEDDSETIIPTFAYKINLKDIEKTIETINTALKREVSERREHFDSSAQLTRSLEYGHFRIQTLEQAQLLAHLLASYCPNSDIIMVGLSELLINAVEHGNLGITYADKSILHKEGRWLEEIYERLRLPENLKKFVDVKFERTSKFIQIVITDQGNGFEWKKYSSFDQSRLLDQHGRGIMMAKSLSFSTLEYNDKGNSVTCRIDLA